MNKVFMIGNLTRDPESIGNSEANGAKFTIAVNRGYGEETDFFPVTVWRRIAESCLQYLSKGRKVAIVGEIRNRKYTAKDGTEKTVAEINASEVEFLSTKTPATEYASEPTQSKPDYKQEKFGGLPAGNLPF